MQTSASTFGQLVVLFANVSLLLAWSAPQARQAAGRLRVEARDLDTDRTVASRFYLIDSAGAPRVPAGVIAYHKRDEHHFVADGGFDTELPAGRYRLVVERGPEYVRPRWIWIFRTERLVVRRCGCGDGWT
jgi:hypothetical protein